MTVQYLGDVRVNRLHHVWQKRLSDYKCVLCGGTAATPSRNDTPDGIEPLTEEERDLCPGGDRAEGR